MNDQEALERYVRERQTREMWANYFKLEQQNYKPGLLMTFEITHKCYLKCRHCFAEACPDNNDFLDLESIVSIAASLPQLVLPSDSQFGSLSVRITGGDPYLHPQVFDVIQAISKQKSRVHFLVDIETSGGFARDEETTTDYVGRTREANADCISMTSDKYHKEQNIFPNYEHGERIRKACENVSLNFRYITIGLPVAETLIVENGIMDFYPVVAPIGRARDLPETHWMDTSCVPECAINPFHNYHNVMVDPKGNVYLCYSGKIFPHANISVGNIREKGFLELLASKNPILEVLKTKGIIGLSEHAGLSLVEHYTLLDKMGPCGLCHEVLRNHGKRVIESLI